MRPEIVFLVLPFVVAFVVSMMFGPGVIAALRRQKVGQTISGDGPESHQSKAGTPTMGGLIILAGVLGAVLVSMWVLRVPTGGSPAETPGGHLAAWVQCLLAVILLMVGYAILGMVDDYLTIHPVRGIRGIASKPKAAAQLLLTIAFVMWLAQNRPVEFEPILYAGATPLFGGILYWIFSVLFITGMANFVNITDGLDGLVAGLTAIAAAALGFIFWLYPHGAAVGAGLLHPLLMSIAGACLAFLWFNANPARVFMGDTGALALGVGIPAIAVLAHREILVIVVGLVFILDGLSSALQWAVFKYTRVTTGTGRRIFKKSPVHHHFELSGWPEQKVVVRFWILGAIAALIGFTGAAWGIW